MERVPAAAAVLLAPFGWLYGAAMAARNALYDARVLPAQRLLVPVVSVGNLAAGGTGKTPLVAWLLEQARAHGRRPAVLSRGYGRASGAPTNDEGVLLERRYPWTRVFSAADRVAAGAALVAAGFDYAILDDGFQHRRLHRDVDLVCLDATRPFDRVLPAGLQREPRAGLRRASAIVLTRADAADAAAGARVNDLLARVAPGVPVFRSRHRPRDLLVQPEGRTEPCAALRDRPVWLLSGIARPEAFAATVRGLGARVLGHERRRDHARLPAAEVEALASAAAARDAWLVVTEKDDARLLGCRASRRVLRIDLEFDEAPGPERLRLR